MQKHPCSVCRQYMPYAYSRQMALRVLGTDMSSCLTVGGMESSDIITLPRSDATPVNNAIHRWRLPSNKWRSSPNTQTSAVNPGLRETARRAFSAIWGGSLEAVRLQSRGIRA